MRDTDPIPRLPTLLEEFRGKKALTVDQLLDELMVGQSGERPSRMSYHRWMHGEGPGTINLFRIHAMFKRHRYQRWGR